jgi:hypothetical protein
MVPSVKTRTVHRAHVHAQRLGHLAVVGGGADDAPERGSGQQPADAEREREARRDHEQVVDRHRRAEDPRLAVVEVEPAGGDGRRPPGHADQVFEHEDEGEGQQELERLVAIVDEPEQAALDHDADQAGGEAAQHEGKDEERRRPAVADEELDGGDAGVGAQRIEGPARQVEDLLDAEDHLQAGRDQEKDGGMEDAAHQYVDEVRGTVRDSLLDDAVGAGEEGGGSAQPSARAVLRLIASSKVVGCSMGRSPARAPLKI